MYSKIKISGTIEVVTGLHIGGGGESSMIGSIDSPVVRDLQTKLPMIPGSSIKGKMRGLLAKHLGLQMNQDNHNDDHEEVLRIFGSSEKGNIKRARLQVSDAFYSDYSKQHFAENDISYTETKFENTINRLTAVANPRQIERVTRGSEFDFTFIYNVDDEDEVEQDFKNIEQAVLLLENDYLGGGGTRGNGRVEFKNINLETVVGDYDSSYLKIK
ncbi:CRISPR-associated protein Csm3 [Staphylococcus auricularis]|uniref:type III-A CRISPR-associated RAMP protein Csm3 n=1 Tax=Staphylococcus auricularis TaxID=29379 RepID=UPI0019320B92|nr:type III-A CRISPR-associated RAMP protein Csm3 [Staphylococcus auricularis]MBM0868306.1 type III-A CRISPR-associated RAMP protein Csm3 [Staphylococcus auricularis]MCG7342468.1 type III-A CRISPR-associated RAMP protein Csm3 [Staphylococcus auricularis]